MKNADGVDEYIKNANKMLDAIIAKLGLKNDVALSRCLEVAPPVISKIRHGRLWVGASMLISLHETSDLSIAELKSFFEAQSYVPWGNWISPLGNHRSILCGWLYT
ncbi:hypothetical protein BCF11_0895 [Collimonas sp. PA-H2]|uniref:hypothetical protein n=1 Tax=Collimonas sp. PA-H2 TaxID=1881062 RepID=UPI000C01E21A|nr:hypothetical protein [Collimonas sp. PA-H2]PFH08535.1 hypothetical protein BCF11_0895 [Collimonas sp. PA-H2]